MCGAVKHLKLETDRKEKDTEQAGAVALGVLLCFGVGADFYAALGVNFNVAWLGIALTGIFASRGANYVSDLVKKLQALGAAKTE